MRPLFAIAPLAMVLALIGPTPHDEANHTLASFLARFAPTKVTEPTGSHVSEADKPGLMPSTPALTAMQAGTRFDNSLSR